MSERNLSGEIIIEASKYPMEISKGRVIKYYLMWPLINHVDGKRFDTFIALAQGSNITDADSLEFLWDFIYKIEVQTKEGNLFFTPSETNIWQELKDETLVDFSSIIAQKILNWFGELTEFQKDTNTYIINKTDLGYPISVTCALPYPIHLKTKSLQQDKEIEDYIVAFTLRQPKGKDIYRNQSNKSLQDVAHAFFGLISEVKGKEYYFENNDFHIQLALQHMILPNFLILNGAQERLAQEGDLFHKQSEMAS